MVCFSSWLGRMVCVIGDLVAGIVIVPIMVIDSVHWVAVEGWWAKDFIRAQYKHA